jgi:hypothetical protein
MKKPVYLFSRLAMCKNGDTTIASCIYMDTNLYWFYHNDDTIYCHNSGKYLILSDNNSIINDIKSEIINSKQIMDNTIYMDVESIINKYYDISILPKILDSI